ncbi:MAG: hypothetical protein L3J67_09670 [Hyphomicrobiaceae bacterium]|nr:hypothetical protein [Hyphomicrobiaceae bacterium]
MKRFGSIVLVALVLGGCSSGGSYSPSGEDQLSRIGRIAPVKRGTISARERQRLIKRLIRARKHHREEALREIEAR